MGPEARIWVSEARIDVQGTKMMDLKPEFRVSRQIGAKLLGFEPVCLNFGHIAWIWGCIR